MGGASREAIVERRQGKWGWGEAEGSAQCGKTGDGWA